MILDTLDNLSFYFGMSEDLDSAISVLKHYNFSSLRPGEYPDIATWDSDIVLRVLEPEIVTDSESIPWEYHENVIDVQCVLKGGSELIGYAPRNKLTGWQYDPEKDVAYTSDRCDYLPLKLGECDFAIFFPQDAHRKIQSSGTKGYHKVVFKVPISRQRNRRRRLYEEQF